MLSKKQLEQLAIARADEAAVLFNAGKLMGLAALKNDLDQQSKGDPQFQAFWGIASQWDESARYEIWDKVAATAMLVAVRDPQKGLLQWIKRFW